jgi:aryl-alcohol dehydrogenase-like predicted oxidoreductase
MTFGTEYGTFGAPKAESRKVFDTFAKAGGNFIDTANRYMMGTSEKYVGDFVGSEREKFVIATKYSLSMDPDDPNASGNHRKNMMQSVEASLKRLKMDYIDLLWVHAWDFLTPVEEVMRGLDDLVRMGKVFYIGVSDTPAWIISRANTIAELQGWSRFVGLQIRYSLIDRTPERDLLPMARALDITVTSWGSIGGGILTGKYNKATKGPRRYTKDNPRISEILSKSRLHIAATVIKLAEQTGRTPAQIALAWTRQQREVIPIVGARTAAQLKDNLGCLDFELTDSQIKRLNKASEIDPGFPHEFLASDMVRGFLYGNYTDKIDGHLKDRI